MLSFNAAKRVCNRICGRVRLESSAGVRKSQTVHPPAVCDVSLSIWPVEEAAMDRLKLETAYLRALDVLMSAIDEHQLQVAIFRLRRAQSRLHGWEMQGLHDPERRGLRRGDRMARAGRPLRSSASGSSYRTSRPMRLAVSTDNRRSSGASTSHSRSFSRWGTLIHDQKPCRSGRSDDLPCGLRRPSGSPSSPPSLPAPHAAAGANS